ncbi:MAG: hypothetical protein RIQ96_1402 [Pseudomonadota bacterium]
MILDGRDPQSIAHAVERLAQGALVAFPTETVYGLGADACNDAAVRGIFAAKGRPSDHPLIVHVADTSGVAHFARKVPAFAQRLIDAFWPGPLTLILPRREGVATASAGGQGSIGVRCPSHPVAQALLRACAQAAVPVHGLSGPSANRFGRVSPTTAQHVASEFGDGLLILDGGACEVGIESTIVDCTRGAPVLLRPGMLTAQQIEAVCGMALRSHDSVAGVAPRASGTLEAHYAPRAKVRLMDAKALQAALNVLGADAANLAVYARTSMRSASRCITLRRMPGDAAAAAHELFAALRELDADGVQLIWIEEPPPDAAWDGVRDRLQRAAAA